MTAQSDRDAGGAGSAGHSSGCSWGGQTPLTLCPKDTQRAAALLQGLWGHCPSNDDAQQAKHKELLFRLPHVNENNDKNKINNLRAI